MIGAKGEKRETERRERKETLKNGRPRKKTNYSRARHLCFKKIVPIFEGGIVRPQKFSLKI